eukprot:TRINITY_DN9564_c0_g1_i1.p1 TRINITY_DN9564_c0_g1~~TRINITY_DN9564_c0_g1_i1.p1  ORF type:complete len:470 (-),score=70.36 TRINITY_DN9564_c0_g1_i1:202-1611(-)
MIKKKNENTSGNITSLVRVAFIGSNASMYREVIDVLFNGEGLGVPDENIPIPEEESGLALKEESFTQTLTIGDRTIQGTVSTPIPLICIATPDSVAKPPSYHKSMKECDADVFVICVSSPSGNWGMMQSEALEYSNDVRKYHPKAVIVLAQVNPPKNVKDNSEHVCKLIGAVKYLEICIFTSTNLQVQNFFFSICIAGIKDSKLASSINSDWLHDISKRVEFTKNASKSSTIQTYSNTSTVTGPFSSFQIKISMKSLSGKYNKSIPCEIRLIHINGTIHVVAYTNHSSVRNIVINRTFSPQDAIDKELRHLNKFFIYWKLPPNSMKLALKFSTVDDIDNFLRCLNQIFKAPINPNPPPPPKLPNYIKAYLSPPSDGSCCIFLLVDDMFWEIFSQLDAITLKSVRLVCKWWSNIFSDDKQLKQKVIEYNDNQKKKLSATDPLFIPLPIQGFGHPWYQYDEDSWSDDDDWD